MKKILSLFLTIILVLGLSACSNQEINNSNSDPNTPITNQNNSNLSGEDSSLTDNLEYAPILKNVSGESYVNLSNTYQLRPRSILLSRFGSIQNNCLWRDTSDPFALCASRTE